MSVKLISYDLGRPETSQSYRQLIEAIKSLGSWAKPMESFWLVDCNRSCEEIRDSLKQYLDLNDRLLVSVFSSSNWASYRVPEDVIGWMKSH